MPGQLIPRIIRLGTQMTEVLLNMIRQLHRAHLVNLGHVQLHDSLIFIRPLTLAALVITNVGVRSQVLLQDALIAEAFIAYVTGERFVIIVPTHMCIIVGLDRKPFVADFTRMCPLARVCVDDYPVSPQVLVRVKALQANVALVLAPVQMLLLVDFQVALCLEALAAVLAHFFPV